MSAFGNGFGQRTAVSWGLIAVSAAGAVGVTALAYSEAKADGGSPGVHVYTDGLRPTGALIEGPLITTSTTMPGMNGAPLRSTKGTHTKSHGS